MPTRPNLCPVCGDTLASATAFDLSSAVPKPGDMSVCLYCGAHLVFTVDLALRRTTPLEDQAVRNNRHLIRADAFVRFMRSKRQ